MIKVVDLNKSFDETKALDGLSLNIKKGSIYGLIGINGSGKTTLIKHLTGVIRPDSGEITMDGQNVYDNEGLKERLGYIPDDLYFFGSYTVDNMAAFYRRVYPSWNQARFDKMVSAFELPRKRKINKFSKGMQKQAAFALVMSTMPEYLILDEPVDGLDPIVRKRIWKLIVSDVAEREMTVLVSSHNLRELEGLIDSVGILEKGRVKLESNNLDELEAQGGLMSLEDLFFEEMGGDEIEF